MTLTTRKLLVIAVLLAAATLLLYRLGADSFQDYDEATYAEITAESLAHGNFLSFTYLNNPYFKKPPLLFWLTSVSRELIPNERVALRLPGVLAAFGAIVLGMLLCFEVSGAGAAVLGGAILAGTSAFIEPARQARFDLLISFFILATFYAVFRARRDARWYVAAGALFGLAILAKGIIAVFALVPIGVYLWLSGKNAQERFAFLRQRSFWFGALAAFLIAVPWHLYETFKFGEAFWDSYLGNEVLARVSTNLFAGTNAPSNAGYLSYMYELATPWIELFVGMLIALPFTYRFIDSRMRPVFYASIAAVLSILIVMFASQTKAVTYLIPLYPFMAVAISIFIVSLCRNVNADIRAVIIGLCTIGVAYGLWLSAYDGLHINPAYAALTELSHEEEAVGMAIRSTQNVPAVYEYNDDDLGSIEYYSALPFTDHPFVLLLSDTSKVEAGSLVFTTVSEDTLHARFPSLRFVSIYEGSAVSLFRIDPLPASFASNIRFRT